VTADSSQRFRIRCDTGLHRVALDADSYWRPAKCPECRARIDRRRVRRARQWLLGNAPRATIRVGARRKIVPVESLALLFLALMLAGTVILHTVADAWWPATVLLFLGRWPWLLPGIPILLLALVLVLPTSDFHFVSQADQRLSIPSGSVSYVGCIEAMACFESL
jgi:hypothetical protein